MRVINSEKITDAVRRLSIEANCHLPEDVKAALLAHRDAEDSEVAREVLDRIIENYGIAERDGCPICQDTGMACVFVKLGQDVHIEGSLTDAINEGVMQGYRDGYLRRSVVGDPIERVNTGDNTPAMIYYDVTPGDRVEITLAPKGFGSENMSKIAMLRPSDGIEGVKEFIIEAVRSAGPNPCPPIVVGVGIGGTFDKAAYLAKAALLRPIGEHNPKPLYASLEEELLSKINSLGIGPQGFGGRTTALAVNILEYPTHIAGLPVAVNINCHVTRHKTEVL